MKFARDFVTSQQPLDVLVSIGGGGEREREREREGERGREDEFCKERGSDLKKMVNNDKVDE